MPPPVLSFGLAGSLPRLTWTNGVLQEADALTGTPKDWTDVSGAVSPYQPPVAAGMKFYRLRY